MRLKIIKKLRTASLNSKFTQITGYYKKEKCVNLFDFNFLTILSDNIKKMIK